MEILLTKEEKTLYHQCVELNGVVSQLEQLSEECIETALAVRKYLRSLKHDSMIEQVTRLEDLQKEIADILIMGTQMHLVFNGPARDIDNAINFKITRQRDRVDTEMSKRFSEPFNPLAHENQK